MFSDSVDLGNVTDVDKCPSGTLVTVIELSRTSAPYIKICELKTFYRKCERQHSENFPEDFILWSGRTNIYRFLLYFMTTIKYHLVLV